MAPLHQKCLTLSPAFVQTGMEVQKGPYKDQCPLKGVHMGFHVCLGKGDILNSGEGFVLFVRCQLDAAQAGYRRKGLRLGCRGEWTPLTSLKFLSNDVPFPSLIWETSGLGWCFWVQGLWFHDVEVRLSVLTASSLACSPRP